MSTKVSLTMPVVLQEQRLYDMTIDCVKALTLSPAWVTMLDVKVCLVVVCNRLAYDVSRLDRDIRQNIGLPLDLLDIRHGPDRGVAGAWNDGIRAGMDWGADRFIVFANDTVAERGCLEWLIDWGDSKGKESVAIWSGLATNGLPTVDPNGDGEGCDFSFFALRRRTVERHGWFDEMFRPAYFEDNDYAARVVLGGEHHRYVYGARFYHHVSQTRAHDPEMRHHIDHWFGINRARFVRKWGRDPVGDEATMMTYNRTPFGEPNRPLSYWGPP